MGVDRSGDKILVGQVLEENDLVTLADLCRSCTVETKTVTTLVAEGILDPMGGDVEHWRFTVGSLKRVKTVIHLQRDLGINLAGAALALDLLDRIAELERH
ncbi:MAG: chaperone modulator CbpM [Xanthomonadales bacterium]|nr:chaperone modulator CbpM [Xanthomonadales bacterium]MDH4017966.1 chaperone modulator CbpM [Xanthomonadales bacterium]